MPGKFRPKPRRRGVFYWRDVVLERAYRALESVGVRFAHRVGPVNFEAMLEHFYRRLPLEGCEVVDVGAHTGRHTVPLARCVGASGRVHAFEPVPHARRLAGEALAVHGLSNVTFHPLAVGAAAEVTSFTFLPESPEESGLRRRAAYNEANPTIEVLEVSVVTLDSALPQVPVRFIKIDVEGAERDVLLGSRLIIDRYRPIIAFECGAAAYAAYHDGPDEIFELFAQRGYVIHSITGVLVRDAAHFRELTTAQAFWDYVALPPADAHFASALSGLRESVEEEARAWRRSLRSAPAPRTTGTPPGPR